jgi:hypothetical protein
MRTPALLAGLAGLCLTGALAAEPPAEPAKQQQRVCRAPAKQLGSRIRTQRRCRTAEQWQAEDEGKSGLPVGAQVTPGQNDGQAVAQPQ